MNRKTFIRTVEYWVPSADGSMLEFGGGFFGDAKRFEATTRALCFGRGEGLPGQAWEAGHPLVIKTLEDTRFRRAAAARAAGLTSAIALPIFSANALTAVMVLFCGDDTEHAGAIELWHNAASESPDMTLQDGYYGTTGDTFEFISRSSSFRRGSGLPGRCWESEAPVFMADLGRGSGFLRAESAVKVGINRGIALPCSSTDGDTYVLAFLSALATPIAHQLEIWQPTDQPVQAGPDGPTRQLAPTFGFAEGVDGTDDSSHPFTTQDMDVMNRVFATGVPHIAGARVATPVACGTRITAVLVMDL